jgi:GR25 family glycosyltransferase involved in LPS biosynthesis
MKIFLIFMLLISLIFIIFNKKYYITENFTNNYDTYVLYIPERYNYIKSTMDKVGLNPKYIKGYDIKDFTDNKILKNKLVTTKWLNDTNNKVKYIKPYNIGRVVCHMSHIKILKKFLNSDKEYALIIEDDINISDKNIKNKIDNISNNIPNDADIVYLSYCFEYCNKTTKINKIFNKSYRPLCRHIYMVTKKGAIKIIDKTIPMFSSGDRMIGHLIKNKKLISYNVNPNYLYLKQKRNNNNPIFETKLDNIGEHNLCM